MELGAGKVTKFTEVHSLDIYAKYFYLHQGSDSFKAGGHYHIHALNSHRLRIAGRYQYNHTARTVLYAGVGGEYEFNAKSKVTLDYGVPAKASDCKGFRGYGEVGVIIKPEGNKGFNFDLGVKGHYGAKYRDLFANCLLHPLQYCRFCRPLLTDSLLIGNGSFFLLLTVYFV